MIKSPQEKLFRLNRQIDSNANFGVLDLSPEKYASQFRIIGYGNYGKLSHEILASEALIDSTAVDLVTLYNKYLMLSLLHEFDLSAAVCRLPPSIAKLYERDLTRIELQLDEMATDFYQLSNDAFVKDLAILSHRLIPVGAEYITPDAGIPRKLIFKRGIVHFLQGVRACLLQCGGFTPYLELHAHALALEDFTPDGWLKTYMRLAELLELNPRYRGIISSSWFLDPALERISPRLSYLRKIPQEKGATILFSGYDKKGKSGAPLATSAMHCTSSCAVVTLK
jgi:hypothetical protein